MLIDLSIFYQSSAGFSSGGSFGLSREELADVGLASFCPSPSPPPPASSSPPPSGSSRGVSGGSVGSLFKCCRNKETLLSSMPRGAQYKKEKSVTNLKGVRVQRVILDGIGSQDARQEGPPSPRLQLHRF